MSEFVTVDAPKSLADLQADFVAACASCDEAYTMMTRYPGDPKRVTRYRDATRRRDSVHRTLVKVRNFK
jgi:hypothetical protein